MCVVVSGLKLAFGSCLRLAYGSCLMIGVVYVQGMVLAVDDGCC